MAKSVGLVVLTKRPCDSEPVAILQVRGEWNPILCTLSPN